MTRNLLTSALCFAALGLTACAPHDGRMAATTGLCPDFKSTKTVASTLPVDAQPVDECVRRWAYSLASSHDDADTVAQAASSACAGVLSRWNQQTLAQGGPSEAVSITTGQPTTALAEHNSFAQSRALFHVVAARAGRCAAPPITNGVPDGLPG